MTAHDSHTTGARGPDLLAAARDLRDAETLLRVVPPGPACLVAHERAVRARATYASARAAARLRRA